MAVGGSSDILSCAKGAAKVTSSKQNLPKMRILNEFVGKQYQAIMAQPIHPHNMKALREAFAEFDQNSDGFISKEELSNAMTNFGHMMTSSELDEMIKLVDKDGNGLVDFKEFLNLMEGNCTVENTEEELQNLFALIDANQDGFLSEKEICKMMKNLGEKVRKKDIRQMIKAADLNKDGKISYNEFKIMVNNGNVLGGL